MTKAAAVERVQARTRQFARKQLTWFRSLQGAQWIEGTRETGIEQLTERVLRLWQKRSSAV